MKSTAKIQIWNVCSTMHVIMVWPFRVSFRGWGGGSICPPPLGPNHKKEPCHSLGILWQDHSFGTFWKTQGLWLQYILPVKKRELGWYALQPLIFENNLLILKHRFGTSVVMIATIFSYNNYYKECASGVSTLLSGTLHACCYNLEVVVQRISVFKFPLLRMLAKYMLLAGKGSFAYLHPASHQSARAKTGRCF